jgi:branched-subunit amino acid aminotransferase/4-amino-4-deoxychorismate lyase
LVYFCPGEVKVTDGWWMWVGGEEGPVRAEDGRIPALDHGYLYGAAIYETLRTYHARPFALRAHLSRLDHGARRMGFPPTDLESLADCLRRLADLRAPEESYLRVTLSPGARLPGGYAAPGGPARWTAVSGPLPPHVAAYYERGVRGVLSRRTRWNPGGFIPAVKFAGNPDLHLARREAEAEGAFEALLLNSSGFLAEGSSSNVFLVKGNVLVTPDLASGILDGVTRSILLDLAPKAGVPIEERPVRPGELFEAGEAFLASTLKEVVPLVQVDGRPVGSGTPGLLTDRLLGLLQEHALEATTGDDP